jgi:ATP-dependent RNA helicase DDX56/DBP9
MDSAESLLDPQDTFATLCTTVGLDIRLRKGLSRLGYVRPTLVQSKCLPLAITSGRDLLVRARTGSGKTLAYCLPILHKILCKANETDNSSGFVKAVILVPTRELCTQVTTTLNSLIYYCDEMISIASLFSGKNSSEVAISQQEAMLRDRPDVLVSTPAGLVAHINRDGNCLKTSLKESVESLVVDEADLVLSFGKCILRH